MEHPFATIKDSGIWAKAYGSTAERQVAELTEEQDTKATLKALESKFQELIEEIQALEAEITSATNKASFLSKIVNLRQRLPLVPALGDFALLEKRIAGTESYLLELIAENRRKNQQIKEALLEELRAAVALDDWREATRQVKSIKERWIKTGAVASELREKIEGEFTKSTEDFFKRRQEFLDDRQAMIESRKEEYRGLIERAKDLDPSYDAVKDEVDALHGQWKEVGWVPAEANQALWKEFKEALPKLRFQKGGAKRKEAPKTAKRKSKPAASSLTAEELAALKAETEALGLWEATEEELDPVLAKAKAATVMGEEAKEDLQQLRLRLEMLREAAFVQSQAAKRKLATGTEDWRKGVKKIVRDLLNRDLSELATMEENLEKFSAGSELADKLLGGKLKFQQRKVEVKKALLAELRQSAK